MPIPLGEDRAIQRPPSDSVGMIPVQISSMFSTWAASSTTSKDTASERPASADVGIAFTTEPLDNSNEFLLSTLTFEIFNQSGIFARICFTFLTMLLAVLYLVAITRTFLSL